MKTREFSKKNEDILKNVKHFNENKIETVKFLNKGEEKKTMRNKENFEFFENEENFSGNLMISGRFEENFKKMIEKIIKSKF